MAKRKKSFFERLIAGDVDPSDLPEQAIDKLDRWDVKDWQQIHKELKELAAATDELAEVVPTGRPMMADTFWSFFKVNPELVDNIDPEFLLNLAVMKKVTNLSQWQELRRFTRGDDVAAGMACVQLEPDLETFSDLAQKQKELYEQFMEKLRELNAKRQELRDAEQMYRDLVEEPPEPPEEPPDEGDLVAPQPQGDGEDEGDGGEPGGEGQGEGQIGEPSGFGGTPGPSGAGAPGQGQGGQSGQGQGGSQGHGQGDEPTPEQLQQMIDDLQKEIDELEKGATQAGNELEGEIEKAANGASGRIANKIGDIADELRTMSQSAESWGLEPGTWQRLPAKERFELAQRLNSPRLQRIAEIFGPMKELAFTEQQRKVEYARTEVVNITQGHDVESLLPTELLRLRDPRQRHGFYRDFAESKLLQYHLEGKERVGKGGIILLEDGSGSMSGEKEMWAKAVMLCLLHIARKQNRSFHLVHFGSPRQFKVMSFDKPGDFTTERIVDAAELFFGGGTDFETPFNQAVEILQAEFKAKGFVSGDIVMVTDGVCGVTDQWKQWFAEERCRLGFTSYGVLIGGDRWTEPLTELCEGKVCGVKSLATGGDVRDVFRGV